MKDVINEGKKRGKQMTYDLTFKGMHSNEALEENLAHQIDDLLEKAPSDSSAYSFISKVKKVYCGILDIFSSQGHFVAKAVGRDINELTKSLFQQLYKQLKVWRIDRNSEDMRLPPGEF